MFGLLEILFAAIAAALTTPVVRLHWFYRPDTAIQYERQTARIVRMKTWLNKFFSNKYIFLKGLNIFLMLMFDFSP